MWSSSKLFSVCIRGSAFLFQGLTMCFICIIVITSVGRRPAAAPGNYQMRPVFLPSFFVPLWITQIARSKHLARTRASLEAVLFFFFFYLNDTFCWMPPELIFFEEQERRREREKISNVFYSCWPNTSFLWLDVLLSIFSPVLLSCRFPLSIPITGMYRDGVMSVYYYLLLATVANMHFFSLKDESISYTMPSNNNTSVEFLFLCPRKTKTYILC